MKEFSAKVQNPNIAESVEYRFDDHQGCYSCILFEDGEYTHRIGKEYKTIAGALKVAKKHAEEHGYKVDFEKVKKYFA